MFGKSSFLRNLSGLPAPPTPPKTPSTLSRRVSDDELSNEPSSTPSSSRYPPIPLGPQTSNGSNYSSLYPSLDLQDEDEFERTIRRRPRRANGASGTMPGSLINSAVQPPSRQSIYALDANHAKRMEDIGRQRRLQSLRQAESIADTEGEDNDDPPPVPKKAKPNAAPTPPANPLLTPPLDDSDLPSTPNPVVTDNNSNDIADSNRNPDHIEDIKALENLLNETVTELQAAKDYAKTLKAQHDAEKRALFARIQALEEQNTAHKDGCNAQKDIIHDLTGKLNDLQKQEAILQEEYDGQVDENAVQRRTIQDLKATAQKTQTEMSILTKEKQTWQQKLDGMHNRLHNAERQLRCLDHVTRAKLDSRQSGIMADIKRNPLFASKGLGAEILNQINALNAWIQPTAQLLAKDLLRSVLHRNHSQTPSRSVEVLGEGMTVLLQVHANQTSAKLGRNFLQTVMEIFLVHWASMIIEAWYPKQQSFADILAEISAQKHNNRTVPRIQCGTPVKILSTMSPTTDFQNWAVEILKDLDDILLDADVVFPSAARNDVRRNLVTLSEKAYDLRTSLAERDLCGNIQLALVSPDTLFQAKWMEDVQVSAGAIRRGAFALADAERVAGTCRLGLQIPGTTSGAAATLALKPKVVLLSKLKESL